MARHYDIPTSEQLGLVETGWSYTFYNGAVQLDFCARIAAANDYKIMQIGMIVNEY